MRPIRGALQREHVETNLVIAPLRKPLQKEARGANDSALLAPGDRPQRAAVIQSGALPHLDDRQNIRVPAYQIEFTCAAAQIARDHQQTPRLQILGRDFLG